MSAGWDLSGFQRGLDLFVSRRRMAFGDIDAPWFQGFRYSAHQIDLKQAVLEGGTLDLDMIGEAEAALERTCRDALIDVFVLGIVPPPSGDGQQILLRRYGHVFRRKPGQGHRD